MSSLIEYPLRAHRAAPLGVLLGWLAASPLPLWPFLGATGAAVLPEPAEALAALAMALAGFAATAALERLRIRA